MYSSIFFSFQNLNGLLENYLEPLKKETFLSGAEINALFGNILEIVAFQRQFLQNLVEALENEADFHHFDQSSQFKVREIINYVKIITYIFVSCLYTEQGLSSCS